MPAPPTPCVVPLTVAAECGARVTGAKAHVLGLLASRGIPVPDGFVLLADPGRGHVPVPDTHRDPDPALAAADRIVEGLGDVPLLVRRSPVGGGPAASRSSPVGGGAIMGIRGSLALHDAVRRSWDATSPILVQRFVVADCAGVIRPSGTVDGGLDVLALPGGAPRGRSGAGPADRWSVRDGVALPRSVSRQALTRSQVQRLGALAMDVLAITGGHREMDWVMAEQRFWVVQSRPIG